jgi:hypothetical protein
MRYVSEVEDTKRKEEGKKKKEKKKEGKKIGKKKNELSIFLEIMIHNLYWLYYYWIIKIKNDSYM